MKEGWEYKKLGEVCMHKNKILHAAKHYASDEQITYIDISSIDNSQNIILSTTPYVFSDAPSRAQQIVEKGDVLVSLVRPNLKNIAIVNIDNNRLVASSGFCVLRAETNINNRYIFYIVRGNAFTKYLLGRVQGANYPAVREDDVKSYSIPIPPLAEQERIVAELDLLSSIIDKKKAQLKELDQLAQSIFYDMFGDPITNEKGWEVKKLGESVHEMFLGPFGSSLKVDSYVAKEESYCMVYEQKHAIQGTISLDNHYINKDKYESLKRFEVKPNDFIMSCRGTIGRLFQLPHNAPLGIIHPSLMKIRIKDEVYNAAYFQFMLVKIVANENTNGNCVQMAITAKQLSKKELTIPPLPLQQEFADKVEAIERQKTLIQQSIVETQTLFDSRMDYWFD